MNGNYIKGGQNFIKIGKGGQMNQLMFNREMENTK